MQSYYGNSFRSALLGQFRHSLARLQQASVPAVTVLRNILADDKAPLAVKARAAYYILEQTRKAVETDQIERRVAELERNSDTKGGR